MLKIKGRPTIILIHNELFIFYFLSYYTDVIYVGIFISVLLIYCNKHQVDL